MITFGYKKSPTIKLDSVLRLTCHHHVSVHKTLVEFDWILFLLRFSKAFAFVAIVLIVAIQPSNGFTIDCIYKQFTFTSVLNVYTCEPMLIRKAPGDRIVTGVSQNHPAGRMDSDVRGFHLDRSTIEFIPEGLATFWPNLELIVMRWTSVNTISAASLVGLRNLRQIILDDSNIVSIDNDVFVNNPLIRQISLLRNPVRNVGNCAFEELSLLTVLDMRNNMCMNQRAATRVQVTGMVPQVVIRCPTLVVPVPPRTCRMLR